MPGITPQFGAVYQFKTETRPDKEKFIPEDGLHRWLGIYCDKTSSWTQYQGVKANELTKIGFTGLELFNAYQKQFTYLDSILGTKLLDLLDLCINKAAEDETKAAEDKKKLLDIRTLFKRLRNNAVQTATVLIGMDKEEILEEANHRFKESLVESYLAALKNNAMEKVKYENQKLVPAS